MSATEVLGTRVGDGYKQRFNDMCGKIGVTPREVIENLVDDFFNGRVDFSGGHIENGLLTRVEDDSDEIDYEYFGFDKFVKILQKKDYPDEYIKKQVDSMVSAAYDAPTFNPKKCRGDWGA